MKLVVEEDVVKAMDLSSSKTLDSVTCDVHLAEPTQIASDSSWVRAVLNLLEDQNHQALIQGSPPRTPACGLEGHVRKATGLPGGNADIFKAVEDIRGTSMVTVSLAGRYHQTFA